MGGFFSSSPSAPPPVVIAAPAPAPSSADDDDQIRRDTIERNRRGLRGTIATSETGVLSPRQPRGKSLLGE